MSKPNTPKEEELETLIERRIKEASTATKSSDEVVHIAWLADGIDLWHRSNGKRGHSPTKARRYIISSVSRAIAQAEINGQIKTLDNIMARFAHALSDNQGEYIAKLYAEYTGKLKELEFKINV